MVIVIGFLTLTPNMPHAPHPHPRIPSLPSTMHALCAFTQLKFQFAVPAACMVHLNLHHPDSPLSLFPFSEFKIQNAKCEIDHCPCPLPISLEVMFGELALLFSSVWSSAIVKTSHYVWWCLNWPKSKPDFFNSTSIWFLNFTICALRRYLVVGYCFRTVGISFLLAGSLGS
jgi:hypothetical protein